MTKMKRALGVLLLCSLPHQGFALSPSGEVQSIPNSKISSSWQRVLPGKGDGIWHLCGKFAESAWADCLNEVLKANPGLFPKSFKSESDLWLRRGVLYLAPVADGSRAPLAEVETVPPVEDADELLERQIAFLRKALDIDGMQARLDSLEKQPFILKLEAEQLVKDAIEAIDGVTPADLAATKEAVMSEIEAMKGDALSSGDVSRALEEVLEERGYATTAALEKEVATLREALNSGLAGKIDQATFDEAIASLRELLGGKASKMEVDELWDELTRLTGVSEFSDEDKGLIAKLVGGSFDPTTGDLILVTSAELIDATTLSGFGHSSILKGVLATLVFLTLTVLGLVVWSSRLGKRLRGIETEVAFLVKVVGGKAQWDEVPAQSELARSDEGSFKLKVTCQDGEIRPVTITKENGMLRITGVKDQMNLVTCERDNLIHILGRAWLSNRIGSDLFPMKAAA